MEEKIKLRDKLADIALQFWGCTVYYKFHL